MISQNEEKSDKVNQLLQVIKEYSNQMKINEDKIKIYENENKKLNQNLTNEMKELQKLKILYENKINEDKNWISQINQDIKLLCDWISNYLGTFFPENIEIAMITAKPTASFVTPTSPLMAVSVADPVQLVKAAHAFIRVGETEHEVITGFILPVLPGLALLKVLAVFANRIPLDRVMDGFLVVLVLGYNATIYLLHFHHHRLPKDNKGAGITVFFGDLHHSPGFA